MQQDISQLNISMYDTKSPKILTTLYDVWKYTGNFLLCQLFPYLDKRTEIAAIAVVLNHVDVRLCLDRVVQFYAKLWLNTGLNRDFPLDVKKLILIYISNLHDFACVHLGIFFLGVCCLSCFANLPILSFAQKLVQENVEILNQSNLGHNNGRPLRKLWSRRSLFNHYLI